MPALPLTGGVRSRRGAADEREDKPSETSRVPGSTSRGTWADQQGGGGLFQFFHTHNGRKGFVPRVLAAFLLIVVFLSIVSILFSSSRQRRQQVKSSSSSSAIRSGEGSAALGKRNENQLMVSSPRENADERENAAAAGGGGFFGGLFDKWFGGGDGSNDNQGDAAPAVFATTTPRPAPPLTRFGRIRARIEAQREKMIAMRADPTLLESYLRSHAPEVAVGSGVDSALSSMPLTSEIMKDAIRELDDAIYFNGVPSFMRDDWAVTRVNDSIFPHSLVGSNKNNDPTRCCDFVLKSDDEDGNHFVHHDGVVHANKSNASTDEQDEYELIRPHVFSKLPWRNWYKAIGLSRPPSTGLKGPSRSQTFDGREGYVLSRKKKDSATWTQRTTGDDHSQKIEGHGGGSNKIDGGMGENKRVVYMDEPYDGVRSGRGPPIVVPDVDAFSHGVAASHKYYQEVVKLAAAFAIYDQNPRSETVIPAYSLVCVGAADCVYISKHIDVVYEFGVGYFLWFINTDDEKYYELPRFLASVFPNRFIVMGTRYNKRILSAAGTWNAFINFLFYDTLSPVSWFYNANGDFFPNSNDSEDFMRYQNAKMRRAGAGGKLVRSSAVPAGESGLGEAEFTSLEDRRRSSYNPHHTIIKFQHYSFFAYTYRAYMVLGSFDESVYPAYGEDVEMVYRARSMGLTFDDYKATSDQYRHIGSASLGDPKTGNLMCKWSRDNYIKQKWNINMFEEGKPFWESVNFSAIHKAPWGIERVPHRSAYAVDPRHEHCIRTGKGDRIPGDPERACFWHSENVLALMLSPAKLKAAIVPNDGEYYRDVQKGDNGGGVFGLKAGLGLFRPFGNYIGYQSGHEEALKKKSSARSERKKSVSSSGSSENESSSNKKTTATTTTKEEEEERKKSIVVANLLGHTDARHYNKKRAAENNATTTLLSGSSSSSSGSSLTDHRWRRVADLTKSPFKYSAEALALLPEGLTHLKRWNPFDGRYRAVPLQKGHDPRKRWYRM